MKTYLAVDYGRKRVGLAVSRAWLAEPLKVVPTSQAFDAVRKVIEQERVTTVLVGVPDGEIAEEAQTFAQHIHKQLGIVVEEVDETLSSQEAQRRAVGTVPKGRRMQPQDHFAAAVFLQDYLDTHKEAVI